MADYNTMTPGSAVADTLQQIIARKKLEARQAMLDRINAENTQSEIDYRKAQADSMAEERSAMADWRKAQAEQAEEAMWQKALEVNGGQEVPAGFDPEMLDRMRRRGYAIDRDTPGAPVPQVSTSTTIQAPVDETISTGLLPPEPSTPLTQESSAAGPAPAPTAAQRKTYFAQTPAQRLRAQQSEIRNQIIAHWDEISKMAPMQQGIFISQLFDNKLPDKDWFEKDTKPLIVLGPKGNTVSERNVDKNAIIERLNYPPGIGGSGGQQTLRPLGVAKDTGQMVFAGNRLVNGKPVMIFGDGSEVPATMPIISLADAVGPDNSGIKPVDVQRLGQARQQLAAAGKNWTFIGNPKADAAQQNISALQWAISERIPNKEVKALAQQALRTPGVENMTTNAAVENIKATLRQQGLKLTAEEESLLYASMQQILGR